jgi:HEAT repeat protein
VANCWKESLVEPLITLLSDEYEEVRSPAVSCLGRHPETVTNHVPRLRQMLKEGNPGTQSAAMKTLFILKVQLSREELLSALKVPRMDVVSMAMYYLGRDSLTLQEAAILLQNTDAGPRMVGLATLRRNATKDAVGLALPLLKDPDEMVRSRAHQFLTDISGQTLPADQPAAWEKWWQENQATFVPKPMPQRGRPGSRLNRDTPTPETPPPAPQP